MIILGNILNGLGKQIRSAINFLVGNILELGITYYFTAIPQIGIYGFIIASISTTFLTAALNLFQVAKVAHLKIQWVNWFVNPALSAVLAALCARLSYLYAEKFIGGGFALLFAFIISALIYIAVISFQGAFRKGKLVFSTEP
jgi:stage V sporulation protein B